MHPPTDWRSARGQMLVIVALGMTALVAMAGLVIDGGMAWSNRRQVQNAVDSASLAGTRVLGLDLKWRATNASNPSPPPAPFPNPDAAVCDAINVALAYNTNSPQTIPAIDCFGGSDEAVYVDFDRNALGRVGNGIPSIAQGVKVIGTGQSDTFLMGVVGISTIDVTGQATALAGPAAPPLGLLMPFVVQNPLSPFVPGEVHQVRSESEGECGEASLDPRDRRHRHRPGGGSPAGRPRHRAGSAGPAIGASRESVQHDVRRQHHGLAYGRERREGLLHHRWIGPDHLADPQPVQLCVDLHRDDGAEGNRREGRKE